MWGLGAEMDEEQGRNMALCGKLPLIYKNFLSVVTKHLRLWLNRCMCEGGVSQV